MNFTDKNNKSSKYKHLALIVGLFLTSCGPAAENFSILPSGQTAFQGSTANNKVDVLWVVDNSGSMLTKQQTLSSGFASFANTFINKSFDFHMAIITSDLSGQGGVFQGSPTVFTNSTSNFISTFETNVIVGDTGASNAKELDSLELALSSGLLNGSNSGFLRSDAFLSVIIVSDADDDDSLATAAGVKSFLSTLKPQVYDAVNKTYKDNFAVSAVIANPADRADPVGQPSVIAACASFAPYEPGILIDSLVSLTNGSVTSICTNDFSVGLDNISESIVTAITEIPLARVPQVNTINVTFNGSTVAENSTNGWTYSSTLQAIQFHGTGIPVTNTSISVSYIPNDIIR